MGINLQYCVLQGKISVVFHVQKPFFRRIFSDLQTIETTKVNYLVITFQLTKTITSVARSSMYFERQAFLQKKYYVLEMARFLIEEVVCTSNGKLSNIRSTSNGKLSNRRSRMYFERQNF